MKKLFLLITIAALSLAAMAQNPNKLVVTMKNGDVTVFNINEIDSLSLKVM